MSRNSWNNRGQHLNRNRRQRNIPSGLKGREIGLYFKNLHNTESKTISLKIPTLVMSSVKSKIQKIIHMAKENNIQLPQIVTSPLTIKEMKQEISDKIDEASASSTVSNYSNFKLSDPHLKSDVEISLPDQSSTSSFSEVVPFKAKNETHSNSNKGQLPPKSSEFKYGYEDIITGTFDEKLEECLSRGINIEIRDELINNLNIALHEDYKDMLRTKGYKELLKFREILPTFKKSKEILNLIKENQVIVISGETGCGKSTQIPQIILDEAITNNRGANVKILVTQPRRIAASSLAARVAQERGEDMGNTVGYSVRLDKVEERSRGSIQFCTTGVLLVELEVNQSLSNWSHVILDEVHERDCHVDMAMCMLKKVLKKRKDLKLILMSATLDAANLSQYYDNCPVMHIEGLAYPVKDVYLEDILKETKFKLPQVEQNHTQKRPKWHQHVRSHRVAEDKAMENFMRYEDFIGKYIEPMRHKLDNEVYRTLLDFRIEELNLKLVLELLKHICYKCEPGAVLVFLPGIGEITTLMREMKDSNLFPERSFNIYSLHSKLPSLDQHRIFDRPPAGVRKIIVATNIAETSITIDDIVYVVDCGKIKMSGFDVEEKIQTLKVEWVSQANLRQRRGRAGRCQPGICYHLMSSFRASTLEERVLPELQRSNLLEPLLSVKRLRLGMAEEAFQIMPSPPDPSTVVWAVQHLQKCGALDGRETLTPLGWHLARLPLHPAAGKLLLLAALFGCLDRAASVAAVWGFKDPFQLVMGKEREVDEARRYLACGEPSDHIAISEAILRWERCGSRRERQSFAYDNFLSNNTLELLVDMKRHLGQSLKQMGFLASGNIKARWENRNAHNLSLFKALIAAALYPNVASVRWRNLQARNPNKLPTINVYTPEDGKTSPHPSSVMNTQKQYAKGARKTPLCNHPGANWLVYWLKQRSTSLYLLEVTLIYTLPLLFFGEFKYVNDESNKSDECTLSIKTIKVRCRKENADVLCKLRSLLDLVLASKVTSANNSKQLNDFEEEVINAVIKVITAEDEQADYVDDEDDFCESDSSDGVPDRKK